MPSHAALWLTRPPLPCLQAHAHMLGKPVEEEPDAALLNQKFDDGRGGRGHDAEEEEDDEQVGSERLAGMVGGV